MYIKFSIFIIFKTDRRKKQINRLHSMPRNISKVYQRLVTNCVLALIAVF